MTFDIRRVVTGHDGDGNAIFVSDGAPARVIDVADSFAVSDLYWLGGWPDDADAGGDPPEGPVVLEPPPGGVSVRIIRFPAHAPGTPVDEQWIRVEGDDPHRPGMHATDTLDFMVVLDGEIVLGLDDGEHILRPGDTVIQRGTAHRWRVAGDRPCVYAVFMLRTDPAAPSPPVALTPATTADPAPAATGGPRRLVTATGDDGRSRVLSDGPAPMVFRPAGPDGITMVELWQTGGRLARPDQGGDPTGPWELEPRGRGIAFRYVEMPAGHDPGEAGWHTTATSDLDLMLSGRLELGLPGADPVVVGPRESVVQRATNHRWRPVGEEPVRFVALMLAVGD
jgi:quercetin dioxygenase-like cupin family protein